MKRNGAVWIAAGLLLIAAALSLTLYNLYDQKRAEQSAQQAAAQLSALIEPPQKAPLSAEGTEIPDYLLNPEMEMPVTPVEGVDYVGLLHIPALGLTLPVINTWSYPNLKRAPCRYSGSAYLDNLTICAHNYATHFGTLKTLSPGDSVTFTDMDGNIFSYHVSAVEVLLPSAIADMTDSGWPLTLFTCTMGGQNRIAVRCERTDSDFSYQNPTYKQ